MVFPDFTRGIDPKSIPSPTNKRARFRGPGDVRGDPARSSAEANWGPGGSTRFVKIPFPKGIAWKYPWE